MRTKFATEEQLAALVAADDGGPVAITNLLEFNERADYAARAPEAAFALTRREAYWKYAEAFHALIVEFGGSSLFWGDTLGYAIGEGDWDAVWVNHFPSLAALRDARAFPH